MVTVSIYFCKTEAIQVSTIQVRVCPQAYFSRLVYLSQEEIFYHDINSLRDSQIVRKRLHGIYLTLTSWQSFRGIENNGSIKSPFRRAV